MIDELKEIICTKAAETGFSGAVAVRYGEQVYEEAFGLRDRANELPNTVETRFGIASGTKGFTALAIAALIGSGDGGAYSTISDMDRFWSSLKSGKVLPPNLLEPFTRAQNYVDDGWYGFGFWIDKDLDRTELCGHDAGVSFYSSTARQFDETYTIISDTSTGAWPLGKVIKDRILQQYASR